MKVLHVYKTCKPNSYGGVETFIDDLCSCTVKHGVQNTVLTIEGTPNAGAKAFNGYVIHQAKLTVEIASTRFSLSAIKKYQTLVNDADIIHYHYPNPFSDFLHVFYSTGKPSIVTYHSDIVRQRLLSKLYAPLQKRFFASVDHIVSTSPNYYESSEFLRLHRKKTSVIPIGIDINKYKNPTKDQMNYWRKKLDQPFFLFIGALRYYKGLLTALDAVKGEKDLKLVIAGAGGIEKQLRKKAKSEKIINVEFLGFVSEAEKLALIKLCLAFIFPSNLRSEAFGISLLEAAAMKKPMISCEIGSGTSYVNIHNETGLVIGPSNKNDLRSAMMHLLQNQKDVERFGNNAVKRVKSLFDINTMAESYVNRYEQILSKDRG